MSKEELEIQYNKQQYIAIQVGSLELATTQGLERGLEQGFEQGVFSTARNMKKQGFELEIISKATGLSLSQLKNLN